MPLKSPLLSHLDGPGRLGQHSFAVFVLFLLALLAPLSCTKPVPVEESHVEEVRNLIADGYYIKAEARARELLEASGDDEDWLPPDKDSGDTDNAATENAKRHALARAEMMSLLSGALRRINRHDDPETLDLARRSLERKIELLGAEHPVVASGYFELGRLHFFRNEIDEACTAFEHALGIQECTLDPLHPDTAMTLIMLGGVRDDQDGGITEALEYLARAARIQDSTLPADHPDVAERLNMEGAVQQRRNFTKAQRLCARALAMRQRVLRPGHPLIANSHRSLGILLEIIGDYSGARQHLERSLAIFVENLGPDHLMVASSLMSLAGYFSRIGDLEESRRLYESALEIQQASQDREHRSTLHTQIMLANVLYDLGKHDEARLHFEHALAVAEQESYQPKTDLCYFLCCYGDFLRKTGRFEEAAAVIGRATEIARANYGEDHLQTLFPLHIMARLHCSTGNYAEARDLLNRISDLHQQAEDHDHVLMLETLNDLGRAQAALGENDRALETALQAEQFSREHLLLTSRTLEAQLALRYAASGTDGLHLATAIAARCARQRLPGLERAFDAVIHWRALVLDELVARNRAARDSADPEMEALLTELRLACEELSGLTVCGGQDSAGEPTSNDLRQARERKASAERKLAEASAAFRKEQESLKLGLVEVREALPEDSALVAYFRYEDSICVDPGEAPLPSYLAFVISSDSDDVHAVPLGTNEEIDGLVDRWRNALRGILPIRLPGQPNEGDHRTAGLALRQKIWDPLTAHLAKAKRIFIVPDASLHLVSFAALPDDDGGYLLEQGPPIHYLTAERDLCPSRHDSREGSGILVFGAPDFGDAPPDTAVPDNGSDSPADSGFLDVRYASLGFSPLPQSVQEAEEVASLWPDRGSEAVACLTGALATEAAFKTQAPGCRMIHLATHGYFFDPRPFAAGGGKGEGTRAVTGLPETRVSVSSPGANPLLRAGLALANANTRGASATGDEDGILTAEEIAALDLTGVQLAVLSACGTGLGTVQAGEGVFGLRRAFRLAGVNTVVMSLWPVDDEATRFWMEAFYRSRLYGNRDMAQAVREASLSLLENRREKGLSDHPFHWAAFVAAGDWR